MEFLVFCPALIHVLDVLLLLYGTPIVNWPDCNPSPNYSTGSSGISDGLRG